MSIIVKSGVQGKVPTSNQLDYGQIALNYADQKLYFKNSSNVITPLLSRPLEDLYKTRIFNPEGGAFVHQTSSITGALSITLPAFTSSMVTLRVNIFEYVTGRSFVLFLQGYTYAATTTWINTSASIVGDRVQQAKLIVRFGTDGVGKPVIYIGDTAQVWSYPQVHVMDVSKGYQITNDISTSWSINYVTSFGTIHTIHDLTNQKFAYTGTFYGGRANLELIPVVSNTTNWYRIASLSLSNASCYTRFLIHWGHTTYEVRLSNGPGGTQCLLEVKLLGNYTYYDRYPADFRLVESGVNLTTHVDIRFAFIGASAPMFTLHILEQFTQVDGQITYPGTNLGSTESNNWYGMRMSNASAFTYGSIKIRAGNYQREAYPGFAVTTGTITNQTVVT